MESEVSYQRNFKSAELTNIYIYTKREMNYYLIISCLDMLVDSFENRFSFFFFYVRDQIRLKKKVSIYISYIHKR